MRNVAVSRYGESGYTDRSVRYRFSAAVSDSRAYSLSARKKTASRTKELPG